MKKTTILLLLIFTSIVSATNLYDYEPQINDSRAKALGKTSLFSSSGANYLFNNPSMLSSIKDMDIRISFNSKVGDEEVIYIAESPYIEKYNIDHEKKTEVDGLAIGIPFAMDDGRTLTFGVGYHPYYNFNNKSNYKYISYDYMITQSESTHKGVLNVLSLGFSLEINKLISIGFSYNKSFDSRHNETTKYKTIYDHPDAWPYSRVDYGFSSLSARFYTMSSTISISKLRFATVLRLPFKLKSEGKSYYTDYSTEEQGYLGDFDRYNRDLSIPYGLTLALNYTPVDLISIFTELSPRNLDAYSYDRFSPYDSRSKSGYSFKFGVELDTKLKVRSGFYMQSIPEYEKKITIITQDNGEHVQEYVKDSYSNTPLSEIGYTLGFGYEFLDRFEIDCFGGYSHYTKKEEYGNYVDNNVIIEHKKNKVEMFELGLSLGYKFNFGRISLSDI